jgi:hypothetical protein
LSFRFVHIQCALAIKAYNQVLLRSLKLSNLCSCHQSCIQIAGAVLSFWLLCDVKYFHTLAIMLPQLVPQVVSDRADVRSLLSGNTCRWRLELLRRRMWQKLTKKSVCFFVFGATAPVGHGLLIHEVSRSYTTTIKSVGLLWANDQLVAETST